MLRMLDAVLGKTLTFFAGSASGQPSEHTLKVEKASEATSKFDTSTFSK